MAERPTRQPAAGPRIQKAPTTGHPARPAPAANDTEPEAPSAVGSVPEPNNVDEPAAATPPPAPRRQAPRRQSQPAAPVKEPLVQFGGRIRESTRRRAKIYAAMNDVEMQDLLDEALTDWLERHGG